MKKLANFYYDGKIMWDGNGRYYCKGEYLYSKGIYKTKIKEEDLPEYYIKLWQYPRYEFLSLKNVNDIYYKPNFHFNHWRKDDGLYISYDKNIGKDKYGYICNYDVMIYGSAIDNFIEEYEKYCNDKKRLDEIKRLMKKKDKWFEYWDKHNWDGDYFFTSKEIWKEIEGEKK